MKRRLLKVLLPVLAGFVIACLACYGTATTLRLEYQSASRQETARLIGALFQADPGLDQDILLQALRAQDLTISSEQQELGEKFLRSFGYLPHELVTPSAKSFERQLLIVCLSILAIFASLVVIYFWLLDYFRQRHISRLVSYLQDLNDHIYDLRLEENREDDLSLLTNELYKITVTLKEAAEQNRTRRQDLEDALADISHQLRTPLTSLQVMVDNIYDDPDMPLETRQDFLRSISHQIETMSELVMTLLNLARLDNGSIKFHNQTVIIKRLLQNVGQNLAVLADLHNIELIFSGDLTATVELDLRWQTEALTNIVKNCIEHSPDYSLINVTVEDCPLFLRITIADRGEGISPADLRHIFERFYKASNSSSAGVGIGLSFARTVIEAGGGQVVASSELGEGTKFTVTYFK